ncbi:Shedu anti-phage system protein SduA domain-containing protein [Ornithinimicrobium cavernae]|uniref:Shedu anti-phage system protein SduA domain-containing protein n=1 Tax=Ornithinimicrobium cavernae TaxID=2666047 RepID=UPI000D694B63|nr:Shedu anti-phage system protein SduA domain-containing protein [Ornithinimicrobium cavernae]
MDRVDRPPLDVQDAHGRRVASGAATLSNGSFDDDGAELHEDEPSDGMGRFSADATELKDRFGSVTQHDDGDELVLTRIQRDGGDSRFEMLRFDRVEKLLRIFPRATHLGQLDDQFSQVKELQVEAPNWNAGDHSAEHDRFGLLYVRGLPKGFGSIYEYGLGIRREYVGLIREIEKHTGCTVVCFVASGVEGKDSDGKTFRISLQRFEDYRAAVERSRGRGRTAVRRVVEADCHNATAELFGLDRVEPKYGRNPVISALTEEVATGHVMGPADRENLMSEVSRAAPTLAQEAPERLGKLRADIELVSLKALIERFAASLAGKHDSNEAYWQEFFDTNRFALQQVFSTPIVVRRQHAHVQAAGVDGRGARITDFLCANTVTRTAVVVEIKTPAARLVSNTAYRGGKGNESVYAPHGQLSGAVSQVQSQLAAVPRDLAQRLHRDPKLDIDPWHDLRGAVIVGRVSTLEGAHRDSFLRYRAGLSAVAVLGYDEVLGHLIALQGMLQSAPTDDASSATISR